MYPASIRWVAQWYPSVHWVNQWYYSGIPVYTGPASVHWLRVRELAILSFRWLFMHATPHRHGPLTRYQKFRVAHALGMPGTFSPSLRVSDPDMHNGACVTHVPWCMPGSFITGFLWNQWRGKCSRHSRRMRNPQFHVSGKRLMVSLLSCPSYCAIPEATYRFGFTTCSQAHNFNFRIPHFI